MFANEMKEQQYQPGQVVGFLERCPICTARQRGALPKETPFRIISGSHFGRTGVVVKDAERHKLRPYEFLAQMDNEPPTVQWRILYEIELVEPLPPSPKPDWAPDLSLKDFAALHEEILRLCTKSVLNGRWKTNLQSLALLAVRIWRERIPIPPEELWAVLAAHGVPKVAKRDVERMYAFGLDCLVLACGRKPIKKKRKSEQRPGLDE
jgi:hypothetical protein